MIDLHNTDQKYGYIQIWLKSTEGNLKCCVNRNVFLVRRSFFFFTLSKSCFLSFKTVRSTDCVVFPLRAQVSDRKVIPCWLWPAFLFDEQLGSRRRRDLWKPQLLIGKGDVTSQPRLSSGCGSELWDQALVCGRAATKELRVYPLQCSICAAPFQEKHYIKQNIT